MKFSEQIPALRGAGQDWPDEIGLLDVFGEADLSRPQYDSRKIRSGDAFFAIKGFQSDGHGYIPQAIANGARTIVLEESEAFTREDAERANVARLVVKNSRTALAVASEAAFGNPSSKLRMIGVTGTNGKTTVTTLLQELLRSSGEKVGLIGTIANRIGAEALPASHTTPESRELSELLSRMVSEGVTTCVMEVSSHALALERVAALDFDIAVFTNLTQDHLDFHRTMEAYFAAKQKLFNGLKDTAIAVTNADDPFGFAMVANTLANVHSYGIKNEGLPNADLVASGIHLTPAGAEFEIGKRYSEERSHFRSPLLGTFNVQNVLAAISALYFGVEGYSLDVLSNKVRNISAPRGRLDRIPLKNGAIAVIDYAHTPDALRNILETLKSLPHKRLLTVFGCGGDRDHGKRPQMGEIAVNLSDFVIITSDNPRSEDPSTIIEDILAGIPKNMRSKVGLEPDRKNAIELALSRANDGDMILIAGKGHENYQIFGSERRHFDDREEVLRFNNSH